MAKVGGQENIYRDLLARLAKADVARHASAMGLRRVEGRAVVPFLGQDYLVGCAGVQRTDGRAVDPVAGSVVAGYFLRMGTGEPAGRFVPLDGLTELVRSGNNYGQALEARLAAASGRPGGLGEAIARVGGAPGGEAGGGGQSWLVEVLPKIPAQVVVYAADDEFPATARLLFDITAVNFLEFEFLAVMATIFVHRITARPGPGPGEAAD